MVGDKISGMVLSEGIILNNSYITEISHTFVRYLCNIFGKWYGFLKIFSDGDSLPPKAAFLISFLVAHSLKIFEIQFPIILKLWP